MRVTGGSSAGQECWALKTLDRKSKAAGSGLRESQALWFPSTHSSKQPQKEPVLQQIKEQIKTLLCQATKIPLLFTKLTVVLIFISIKSYPNLQK